MQFSGCSRGILTELLPRCFYCMHSLLPSRRSPARQELSQSETNSARISNYFLPNTWNTGKGGINCSELYRRACRTRTERRWFSPGESRRMEEQQQQHCTPTHSDTINWWAGAVTPNPWRIVPSAMVLGPISPPIPAPDNNCRFPLWWLHNNKLMND